MSTDRPDSRGISRRQFLISTAVAAGGIVVTHRGVSAALATLKPVSVENPLAGYPDRDWERVYRDQYKSDDEFTFLCVPNCTHNCRVKAVMRNGVMIRVEPPYTEGTATDLYGTESHPGWHPRGCLKGYTLPRRIYGPHRVKGPHVRAMWKQWVEDGWPDANDPANNKKYFNRGWDDWVKVSWDEATTLVARTTLHIAQTYGGAAGAALLRQQGYDEAMIEAMHGTGAQTIKLRNGMSLSGVMRVNALVRFVNMLGLIDGKLGGRAWSSYDWHGDLQPGHPMVTGVKCSDCDMNDMRNTRLMVFLGKNMVENKMADAHWWIEIIERGGKVVNVSPEYSPASQKANYWIPVRPGSDTALMLGVARLILDSGKYDARFVKSHTDLPLLIRLDTLKRLNARDIIPGYVPQPLGGYSEQVQKIKPELRSKWGDFVVWDANSGGPQVVTRNEVGQHVFDRGLDPALEGSFTVTTVDGKQVQVKPLLQLYREHLQDYPLETVVDITGAPAEHIRQLAEDLSTIKPAMIATGEGINHYFHNDLTGRAVWLVMTLTGNVGQPGSNFTHWAGNYRGENHPGLFTWTAEDPNNPNLSPEARTEDIPLKKYYKGEHPGYWNFGDKPLKVKGQYFTGTTHMPTPTKAVWIANSNHFNNAKWAHHMFEVVNKKVEMIIINDWEWTGSVEHADVVFAVDSWAEMGQADMTSACSNPFLNVWKGKLKRIYDTRQDQEAVALVAAKMSEVTGDPRYKNYFKYVLEDRSEIYMQRVLDASNTTSGYKARELLESDKDWLVMFRTYPRVFGWEQVHEHKPWYTKTGRMELYKDEDEFIAAGENLIVHREPIEATPYLPNAIVGTHAAIRPVNPIADLKSIDPDERAVRNVKLTWPEVKQTPNPLWQQGFRFYFLTPKSRHRVHSSWAMTDWNVLWDSNFGDPYRNDKRSPNAGEAQIHISPADGKDLGIADGDYVWVDANPADRPYVGWKESDPYYKVARLKVRARYNSSYPRGVTMMKHAIWIPSPKTVMAAEQRPDGLARSNTGYMAHTRTGSHQSATRGWLQPTHMTDSLVRKGYSGQEIGEGYETDVHAPNTCPKETLIKISKAEDGGEGGKGIWKPTGSGFAPGNEGDAMQAYLAGKFIGG